MTAFTEEFAAVLGELKRVVLMTSHKGKIRGQLVDGDANGSYPGR